MLPVSWKPYGLAIVMAAVSVAATHLTWPLFAAAPFALVFAAVAIATHWGSGGAGLFATALAAAGLALISPPAPPFGWNSPSLPVFVAVAIVGNRLIAGRNRATAALRASEARLRATLEQVHASQEQLRRAHKMEAVGRLAAGVAHNFNNLLQVTMGYIDVLLDPRRDGGLDQAAIAEIRKATERGAALTRQLMAFGRIHEPQSARIELDETLAAHREVLTRLVREDIELTMTLASGAAVLIDPYDLEQIVLNLVINARDALPSGGTIAIETQRTMVDAASQPADYPVASGEYVRFAVRDNGVGMTADVQAHLFEPFFTTKDVGEGTGLGLAFVHGVTRQGGGFVTVDSAPGRGTSVAVVLPIAPVSARPPEPRVDPGARAAARAATILLVEDEDAVRAAMAQILTRAGYHVLAAASPQDACALFDLHANEIDLLLTDVVMPGMHGPELAARLAASRPELPVVFVSGYSDAMPALTVVSARAAFVPKPCSVATLISAVEGLLAAASRNSS